MTYTLAILAEKREQEKKQEQEQEQEQTRDPYLDLVQQITDLEDMRSKKPAA